MKTVEAEALAMIGDMRAIKPLNAQIEKARQRNWERGFTELKVFYKKLTGHEYQESS